MSNKLLKTKPQDLVEMDGFINSTNVLEDPNLLSMDDEEMVVDAQDPKPTMVLDGAARWKNHSDSLKLFIAQIQESLETNDMFFLKKGATNNKDTTNGKVVTSIMDDDLAEIVSRYVNGVHYPTFAKIQQDANEVANKTNELNKSELKNTDPAAFSIKQKDLDKQRKSLGRHLTRNDPSKFEGLKFDEESGTWKFEVGSKYPFKKVAAANYQAAKNIGNSFARHARKVEDLVYYVPVSYSAPVSDDGKRKKKDYSLDMESCVPLTYKEIESKYFVRIAANCCTKQADWDSFLAKEWPIFVEEELEYLKKNFGIGFVKVEAKTAKTVKTVKAKKPEEVECFFKLNPEDWKEKPYFSLAFRLVFKMLDGSWRTRININFPTNVFGTKAPKLYQDFLMIVSKERSFQEKRESQKKDYLQKAQPLSDFLFTLMTTPLAMKKTSETSKLMDSSIKERQKSNYKRPVQVKRLENSTLKSSKVLKL